MQRLWVSFPDKVRGCFVAGTLVHTDKGLVPIEKIKVGDMVLSQPEATGEKAYRRVTNTFVFEDKVIYVIKYAIDDPNRPNPDRQVFHLYATGNHPFGVQGMGRVAAQELNSSHVLQLADGSTARVMIVRPIVRTPMPDVGWVRERIIGGGQDITEQGAHIVDFRNGCNFWQYPLHRKEDVGVPYCDWPYFSGEIPGYFSGVEMGAIMDSLEIAPNIMEPIYNEAIDFDTRFAEHEKWREDHFYFKTRVYNIEVEDFHTYYVGDHGVWVHNRNCVGLELLHPERGVIVEKLQKI